jgi:flavin reductase
MKPAPSTPCVPATSEAMTLTAVSDQDAASPPVRPWAPRPRRDRRLMRAVDSRDRGGETGFTVPGPDGGLSGFRKAMGSFATGVTVVTAASGDGNMHGVTVNSFSSVSLDPALVLVCLNETSRGLGLIEQAGGFVVNVLSAGQHHVSRWFANRHRPADPTMFDGVPFEPGVTGSPILLEAAAWFECRLAQLHRAGDHVIVLGEVVALAHRPQAEPLVFHGGTYKSLEHATPGRGDGQR